MFEEFHLPTRLLPRPIGRKPGLVERRPRGRMPVGVLRDRVPLRRRATLRVGIRTSNDCAHSPEWSRDPSADRNSGALDLVILDDRATPANGVAPRPSKKCRLTRHGQCLAPVAGDRETRSRRITLANVTDGGKRQEAIARTHFLRGVCPLLIL